MHIVPVIDLQNGLVVRGVAGRRQEYRPIVSRLVAEPTPRAVAQAFGRLGFSQAYVADLDAIGGLAPNLAAYKQIREAGLALWIDAGAGTRDSAANQLQNLHHDDALIVGLESLPSFEDLRRILELVTPERTIFSLDLKQGQPITSVGEWREPAPEAIAAEVVAAGVQRLIVLDLADVGVGRGSGTLELIRRLRADHPQLTIIAGGGVRGREDLEGLSQAGANAALVASALHDGVVGIVPPRA